MENDKKLPLYEMIVDDEFEGVFAISLVDKPAMQSNFVMFNEMMKSDVSFESINDDEQLIIGLVMEPNKRIPRRTENGYEYEVYASEEIVKKSAHYFLMNDNQNNVTIQHQKDIENISVVETWTVSDPNHDKSNYYGKVYPKNSWAVIMKITDDKMWEDFKKDGSLNGYSLEGKFRLKLKDENDDKIKLSQRDIELIMKNMDNM